MAASAQPVRQKLVQIGLSGFRRVHSGADDYRKRDRRLDTFDQSIKLFVERILAQLGQMLISQQLIQARAQRRKPDAASLRMPLFIALTHTPSSAGLETNRPSRC